MFDLKKGWSGRHPTDVPVFVVTHRPAPAGWENTPITFVTGGVVEAIEQAKAVVGDRADGVDGASIVQQAIRAGLIEVDGVVTAKKVDNEKTVSSVQRKADGFPLPGNSGD